MAKEQFYPITLKDAIAYRELHLITVTGLVYFYIRMKCKPGWKVKLDQKTVCDELRIKKSSYYEALSKLKVDGLIDWEAPKGIVISIPLSITEPVRECGISPESRNKSKNVDSQSGIVDSQSGIVDSQSGTPENRSLKPCHSNDSGSLLYSYQIFINSLSDSAREKFLNFVREKIKDFPKPINDLEGWLAGLNQAGQYRFRVYYEMFQSEVGEGVAPSADWESHPKWQQALAAMRTGVPRFIVLGEPGCEDIDKPTRQAMADYAEAKNLIWGEES